jgi:hypothetical protein
VNISSNGQSEVSHPSLLEVTAATGTVTSAPIAATDHNIDGRLSSWCPSLLQTTVTMGDDRGHSNLQPVATVSVYSMFVGVRNSLPVQHFSGVFVRSNAPVRC